MSKKIDNSGSVLLWLITIALMGFTAFRSVDLIQSTLPDDAQMLAYAALAGLDGGVLAWLFWTTRSAHGGTQRTIGSLMIIVDLAGISAAVLGDTMRIADVGSKEIVGTIAVYVVPVIIVCNVVATVVAHLVDPAQELRDANRTLQDEMERQKAEWVRSNAPKLAAEVAAEQARHHADQEIAKFRGAGSSTPAVAFAKDGDGGPHLGKGKKRR
jgi:hypothetical protein